LLQGCSHKNNKIVEKIGKTKKGGTFHQKLRCFAFLVVISVYNKTKVSSITFSGEKYFPQETNV